MDLVNIAQNVGRPGRDNCGACHWKGGGGDAIKHGDLDSTMIKPLARHDIHMGKHDFTCQECHYTQNHKIAGRCTTCSVSEGKVSCLDCHDERPHNDNHPMIKQLNDHCDAIACQTCHIPIFAKDKPTLMFWDWSKAGKEMDILNDDPNRIEIHSRKKGFLVKKQYLRPQYTWYNGKHQRYLLGDPVNLNGVTDLNSPLGDISDPEAKITPYKIFEGVQPADAKYEYLIIPKLAGSYWEHFNWDIASREGMAEAGLAYSGKLEFVKTRMYWRINHEVVPRNEALTCTHCHNPNGVMDFKALGYREDPAYFGKRKTIKKK